MKTSIYNIWSDLVVKFVATICAERTDLHTQVDQWLDTEGSKQFQGGQGAFFRQHLAIYQHAQHPCSVALFDLAKEQITAGFSAWFEALLKHFPALDIEVVRDDYKQFALDCISEKYYPFIAVRAVATYQLVKSGNLKDIEKVIEIYEVLKEACVASIDSMNAFIEKQKPAPAPVQAALIEAQVVTPVPEVPRGSRSSSPSFYQPVVHPSEAVNDAPVNALCSSLPQ